MGALANLGYVISDQTVGNILHRHALPPAPERKRTTTWPDFIRTHLALLAGTDFFTTGVLALRGLVTYYVLFFIHLESLRVDIAGITIHPGELWMKQIARNVTMEDAACCGTVVISCMIGTQNTPSHSGRSLRQVGLNRSRCQRAERWVRSVKEECLSKMILFGERSLRLALSEYVEHYHAERNHQWKDNVLLFSRDTSVRRTGHVQCRVRLGGLLRYYHQEAA